MRAVCLWTWDKLGLRDLGPPNPAAEFANDEEIPPPPPTLKVVCMCNTPLKTLSDCTPSQSLPTKLVQLHFIATLLKPHPPPHHTGITRSPGQTNPPSPPHPGILWLEGSHFGQSGEGSARVQSPPERSGVRAPNDARRVCPRALARQRVPSRQAESGGGPL